MSKRIATAVLAVLILGGTTVPVRVQAQQQQAQNDELVRRAKNRVQPMYPELLAERTSWT